MYLFKYKRLISALILIPLTFMLTSCAKQVSLSVTDSKGVLKGNLWLTSGKNDFGKGKRSKVSVTGKGHIELSKIFKYASSGVYTSPEQKVSPFKEVALTVNLDDPEGTAVKMEGQIKVDGQWSKWFSWGTFTSSFDRGSPAKDNDNIAAMDTDIMSVKDESKTASSFRYRLTLSTKNTKNTPSIRLVAAAFKNDKQPIAVYNGNSIQTLKTSDYEKDLHVPALAQTIRQPEIANDICSPTSVTMALNYYGVDAVPEETAWGALDAKNFLFGNWVFNAVYASTYGLTTYVNFFNSMDDLKSEIAKGHPVVASVRYRSSGGESGDLPLLEGAPIASTNGHLVIVCGFTKENGKDYVIVNDPAAATNEGTKVKYLADQFDKAWIKLGYVIYKDKNTKLSSHRKLATLVPTGQKKTENNESYSYYSLKDGNKAVNISSDNIKTIVLINNEGSTRFIHPSNTGSISVQDDFAKGKLTAIFVTGQNYNYYAVLNGK